MNKNIRQKLIIAAALMIAATASAFAQGNGLAGINEATSMVSSYFDPGTKLIYAIGAVVGLIGGVKVYGKFSSGDPDTSKTAASWFGACIFFDCRRHYPALILPLINNVWLNTQSTRVSAVR
mgnify:CR=1 FL=1